MNRSKLSENLSRLNETEIDILTYVTEKSIDWFNDLTNSDEKVKNALHDSFLFYCHTETNEIHPMKKVYDKIVDGIYDELLYDEVNLYHRNKEFIELAERINKLWATHKRKYVLIALKAIAERDFEDIANEHDYDDNLTLDMFWEDVQNGYFEDLVNWLDERDLRMILLFCSEG
nr:MAG TPA: hypothetical protein [Ackermannviridae sp.]